MTTALRPLTVGELLDRTFFLYRGHFGLFVGIAALPNLLMLALNLTRTLAPEIPSVALRALASLTGLVALLFVNLFTISVSQGATVIAVSELQLGRETSVQEAFRAISDRIGAIAGVIVGMGLRILAGLLLFIVPGLVWMVKWSLTVPVAVIERTNLSDSLQRSARLTDGHRWRVLLIYLLLLLLIYIVTALLETPTLLAIGAFGGSLTRVGFQVSVQVALIVTGFVTASLLSPIMTIALSLVYYDERVRKEAFDLEHLMAQIDDVSASPSRAT